VILLITGGRVSAEEPFVFSGLPITSPKLQISVDLSGYSDSMLDMRTKFMGREYLSGEWAGAIYYDGGIKGGMTYWFPERFVYPDYYTYDPATESPHFSTGDSFSVHGMNADGFEIFGSHIMNEDLEIIMRYEFRDFGEDQTFRPRIGLVPQSWGGIGDSLPAQRYGFMQTYTVRNISGASLDNVMFYQFLHTLHGMWGAYDERDYDLDGQTDWWDAFLYCLAIQGDSYAFDQRDFSTKKITDTVAMKFDMMPSSYELGGFGLKSAGDHQFGKPATGVHLSVEWNILNGSDFFDPDENNPEEDAWVGGAVGFNLGSLAPGEEKSLSAMLAVKSTYIDYYPPIDLKIHSVGYKSGNFNIDFEETTMNPLVGFILRRANMLDLPVNEWSQVPVPYQINVPMMNWNRFEVPVDPDSEPETYFSIQPFIKTSF
jgi:hypothetical protein